MAAKLEVVITEHGDRMEFDIKGTGERTYREEADMDMIIGVIRSAVARRAGGAMQTRCGCPACTESRKREAENDGSNIH